MQTPAKYGVIASKSATMEVMRKRTKKAYLSPFFTSNGAWIPQVSRKVSTLLHSYVFKIVNFTLEVSLK